MLMGIALIYGATGTFSTSAMIAAPTSALLIAGMLLLMFSMAFKVSAAPFHFWTPDVYDGAPTVFTSFMATVVKAAGFIALWGVLKVALGRICRRGNLLVGLLRSATLL